jgi:F0F1-type ATP synthase assembly protein I
MFQEIGMIGRARQVGISFLVGLSACVLPSAAFAHTGDHDAGGFLESTLHVVSEHYQVGAAIVLAAIFAGLIKPRRARG